MPKISVIVPVYKVEQYLNRCIDSILNQSFNDFELILVDDGSPDNCPVICDEYAKKDNRIIVIHKENGGLSDARNKGIDYAFENSDSEYLTFIDSDDWVHKDYLKFLFDACEENNIDISICSYRKITEFIEDTELISDTIIYDIEEFYLKKIKNVVIACGKLYKKYLFKDIRYPFGKLHEDEFTTYKLLFQLENIVFVNNDLYYYYQNENSIMHNKSLKFYQDGFEGYEEQIIYFYNTLENKNLYNLYFNFYIRYYVCFVENYKGNNKLDIIKNIRDNEQIDILFLKIKHNNLFDFYYHKPYNLVNILKNISVLFSLYKYYIMFFLLKNKNFTLIKMYLSIFCIRK